MYRSNINIINTKRYKYFILICICAVSFPLAQICPQEKHDNFSYIKISGSVINNQSTDALNKFWNKEKGYEGIVETPFYYGNILAGLRILSFSGKKPSYQNFSSNYYFVGWGKDFNIVNRVTLFAGFRVGGFAMSFADDSLTAYQKDETELAAGINTKLNFQILSNIFFNVSAEYSAVFTHKRIELFLLAAGISYKFETPSWMKEFLK